MAQKLLKQSLGLIVVTTLMLFLATALAQLSCTNVLIGMAPCLSYVSGGSSTPTPSCCSQLASVVQKQPRCLCTVLNGGGAAASLGITVNRTLALALPAACDVDTPPVSNCDSGTSNVGSPEGPSESKTSKLRSGSSSIVINVVLLMFAMSAYASIANSF